MNNNDTQLTQQVDTKIGKCKADIETLKEKSKNLEIAISINDNNIDNAKADLLKLDPEMAAIIDDPKKLQEHTATLRTQLEEWTNIPTIASEESGIIDSNEDTALVE